MLTVFLGEYSMVSNSGLFRRIHMAVGPIWKDCLLGGVIFWLPDLIYHCVKRSEPSGIAIFLLTIGMPLGVVVVYVAFRHYGQRHIRSVALSMLLGIWTLGPAIVMLGWTCAGAGFKSGAPLASLLVTVLATIVPILAPLLSGYDLTVLALAVITVGLLLCHRRNERRKGLFRTTTAGSYERAR